MSNHNEPAFPIVKTDGVYNEYEHRYEYANTYSEGGLTKREYFAGLAMQGLLSLSDDLAPEYYGDDVKKEYAKIAVSYADALLAELEKAK